MNRKVKHFKQTRAHNRFATRLLPCR